MHEQSELSASISWPLKNWLTSVRLMTAPSVFLHASETSPHRHQITPLWTKCAHTLHPKGVKGADVGPKPL